jgi:2-polyprenyl-6-hydroxyphenyl methylase/3-demethylubiquinone-9 3-methyltransferase
MTKDRKRFAFGQNWEQFSARKLTAMARRQASQHIHDLVSRWGGRDSFLDIGCGSGLFLQAATEEGFQRVLGFDYDATCVETSQRNLKTTGFDTARATVVQGDVLDQAFLRSIGDFSFVYAWGSLHHTGQMWQAIQNAAKRVADEGILVIAIYNRSITSPIWKQVKRSYVRSHPRVRRWMVRLTFVVAALAKWIHTRKNPFVKQRGMNFYHDIVDWVGGYPYEYASADQVVDFVERLGFDCLQLKRGATPIACNEFVFRKSADRNSTAGPSRACHPVAEVGAEFDSPNDPMVEP